MTAMVHDRGACVFRRPGDQIIVRYRRLGPVTFAVPQTVVEDGPDLTILFTHAGTPIKERLQPDGTPIPREIPYDARSAIPVAVGDGTWKWNHVLTLIRPGDAHDIRLFWREEDWSFRGWYVNLQRPVTRVPVGFDTADHVLDISVSPVLSWAWKDEDELVDAVRIGRFSPEEATAIRAEGERVIARIEARTWPFDAGYEFWRPDPAWPIPEVPANWSEA